MILDPKRKKEAEIPEITLKSFIGVLTKEL